MCKWIVQLSVIGYALTPAMAADPPSGTLSEANPLVTWTGEFLTPTGSADCGGPSNSACDNFSLHVVPPSFGFRVEIQLVPQGDWDLQVFGPGGGLAGDSGNPAGVNENVILFDPAAGTYTVSAAPFAPLLVSPSYTASAVITPVGPPGDEPVTYTNYPAPDPLGRSAAEPSIGVNWKSDRVMYIAGLETLAVSYDDCSSPATDDWADVSYIWTSTTTADPILFTDNITGRTFVSQLAGPTSLLAFTDDDGVTWTPSQGAGIPSGVDHQTVGGGRFHDPLTRDPEGPLYPHAVYYCSQGGADAFCARSDNGGLTFEPGTPIYTAADCGGLHGAVKVAPNDGTVYVPNKNCNEQGVVVSEDNGLTWSVRRVPGTNAGRTDPSVGIATDGTLYIGMADGDGHPRAAVSHDKGLTWENLTDVGVPFDIQLSAFPVMVAGDPDRAAFAFLGTSTPGDGLGNNANFPGVWHVYAAHTYDGGFTWTTVNVTPDDPVQRGSVCTLGFGPTGCQCCRNLLDFNDSDVDRFGRVVIAYADGCLGGCVNNPPNSNTQLAVIARQTNGRRLFAEFDDVNVPAAPLAQAILDTNDNTLVHLTWASPDDHGSPITAYRIYRRLAAGAYSLLIQLPPDVHAYDDTIDPQESYFYQVTAVNALGEGPACRELSPTGQEPPEDCCELPGISVMTDPPGDVATGGSTQHDILAISMAGLLARPGMPPTDLTVTMKVDNLESPPVNSSWKTVFTAPDAIIYFVAMDTDATGAVTFNYGTFTPGTPGTFSTIGSADAGQFSSDGTIRITVTADKLGNPAAGDSLTTINGRTELLVGVLLIATDTTANGGPFVLCSCQPGTPNARDDIAATPVNEAVIIHVLDNDDDPNGDALEVLSVSEAAHGEAFNRGDGTVRYTPDTDFEGLDTFTYVVSDPGGHTAGATVLVIVGPCVFPPLFSGVQSVSAPAEETCTLDLAWQAASPFCPGTSITYNVYRSTDSGFTPDSGTLIAAGVAGASYRDRATLEFGTTYYYIVRAEDSTTFNDGPANGGNEDDNLVRLSGAPAGPLAVGPDFFEDVEPAALSGYTTTTTREPAWSVTTDPTGHSPTNTWFVPDVDPEIGNAPHRDASLILPPLNLTAASIMTFWHNYDFARFPTAAPATRYRSGGVLEISADGDTWLDVGPYITTNGYNGVVFSGTVGGPSPLTGRMAWVGATAGDEVPGRADPMVLADRHFVSVDLGAAIAGLFGGATELLDARLRFRIGDTYVILTNGFQGAGWGIDDITVTGLLAPGPCAPLPVATLAGAVSRKPLDGGGAADIDINVNGRVENGDVTTESRLCGITEVRMTFDVAPAGPGENPVTIKEQPNPGNTQADYAPYSGAAAVIAAIESNDLVLTFEPALENARVYQLTLGPDISAVAPQSIEIRAFFGDVNSDGAVNALDRSVVVGAWTGPGFTPNTDVNHDGSTNALDRSFVIGAWTGSNYCP